MALTPQEAENKYIEMMCDVFKKYEPYIDKILIENFDVIKINNEIIIYYDDIIPRMVDNKFFGSLVILIKEKYSGWDVIYNSEEKTFKYKLKNYTSLNFTDEANKRFELLDIRKNDDKPWEEEEVEVDDIPF